RVGRERQARLEARLHLGLRQVLREADHVARLVRQLGVLVEALDQARPVVGRQRRRRGRGRGACPPQVAAAQRGGAGVGGGGLQGGALLVLVREAGDGQRERGPVLQRLRDLVERLVGALLRRRRAGNEQHLAQVVLPAAGQQRERRRERLGQQVEDELDDDAP